MTIIFIGLALKLVVIFPGNDYEEHYQLIDTWRKIVRRLDVAKAQCALPLAQGITFWQLAIPAEHTLKTADILLYKAKHSGKNRIDRRRALIPAARPRALQVSLKSLFN